MFTTIYNISMVILASAIYYTGHVQFLIWFYLILAIGAIFINFRSDQWIKLYPNLNNKNNKLIENLFDEDIYKTRLYNFIGSYICHAIIVGLFMMNYSVLAAITATVIYRLVSIVSGYNKVRKHTHE